MHCTVEQSTEKLSFFFSQPRKKKEPWTKKMKFLDDKNSTQRCTDTENSHEIWKCQISLVWSWSWSFGKPSLFEWVLKVDDENAFKTLKNSSTKTEFSYFLKGTLVFLPHTAPMKLPAPRKSCPAKLSLSWSWSAGKPVFSTYFTGWVKVENTFKMKKKRFHRKTIFETFWVFLPCTASRMLPVPPKTFSLDLEMLT